MNGVKISKQLPFHPPLLTEDLGLIFEKAICLTLNIPFKGHFKYSLHKAQSMANKMNFIKLYIKEPMTHTAERGGEFDFSGKTTYLSAKTNKKGHKVAPQRIGQATKKTFCNYFNIPESSTNKFIKNYIFDNIYLMLPHYLNNTFKCPILYYNQKSNTIMYIKLHNCIEWVNSDITFSRTPDTWNESSSIRINKKSIAEFQIHNHRNCIKMRWSLLNLLTTFPENFQVETHSLD